ncbi:MAG: hypothetical protein H7Y30_11180, partial [Pyrinomonadaceae bacterium]|nr:hypothetical protein [Pyrinomonadaceae bacterium]
QFYPFPDKALREIIATYPNANELFWTQEEAKNMGGWFFVQPRLFKVLVGTEWPIFVGRAASASPATGSYTIHNLEQKLLVDESLRP